MEKKITEFKIGQKIELTSIEGGDVFKTKITSLGLRLGQNIEIISIQPFNGPLVIKVSSTQIAIGRGMANKLLGKLVNGDK